MSRLFLLSATLLGAAVATSGASEVTARSCNVNAGSKVDPLAAAAGKKLFIGCASCHELGSGKSGRIGPALGAMFNGKPLSAQYNYSKAFREAAPDWRDTKLLDAFLKRPSAAIPGTKMVYVGLQKDQDRKNLIAYLQDETSKRKCK